MSDSGSESSFEVIDDNSSVSSMEIVDNVEVDESDDSESNFSDSSFEEEALETSDVRVTSGTLSEDETHWPVEKESDVKETSESSSGNLQGSDGTTKTCLHPIIEGLLDGLMEEPSKEQNQDKGQHTREDWRSQVPEGLRNQLIVQLVEARAPEPTRLARDVEKECFETARDRDEYNAMIADHVVKEKNRKIANDEVGKETSGASADMTSSESIPKTASSVSTNESTPRPILEEIIGTWKLVAQENVVEYYQTVHGTTKYPDYIGDHLKINVEGSNVESVYTSSGALTYERTAWIEPKNPRAFLTKYTHDYIENNSWFTVREEGFWRKKTIQNGNLRIEYHYGPISATEVYERIDDYVEKKTSSSTETSADSEVDKPQNSQTPSVDAAETQRLPETESTSNDEESRKTPETSESIPKTASSVSTNPHEPTPILKEINGTWKLIAQENIVEYYRTVHGTTEYPDNIGAHCRINVEGSNIEVSQYSFSGPLTTRRTARIEPKNPRASLAKYTHDYIENNSWFTIREAGLWSKKTVQNGNLRIEHHYGTTSFTAVHERVEDHVEETTSSSTEISADSEVDKPHNPQTPSLDAAETQGLPETESTSNDEESRKTPETSESDPKTASSVSTNPHEPTPILEEINGTWKLVAQENIVDYCGAAFGTRDNIGSHLKINVKGSNVEVSRYTSGLLKYQRTARIEPKNPRASLTEYPHDFIESNTWFTVRAKGFWSKKTVQNGKLRIEYHHGLKSFTNVYERVEDYVEKKTSSSTERSVDSEVETPSKNAAETQSSPSTLNDEESRKTPESSSESDSRPILEEIRGCWEVASYTSTDYDQGNADPFGAIGRILKIDVSNYKIEAFKCDEFGNLTRLTSIFQIAHTDDFPSVYSHDFIKNNKLITVYTSNRFDKAWIQDGLLHLERSNGRIKLVLERTEDRTSIEYKMRHGKVISIPGHYIIMIFIVLFKMFFL